MGKELKKLDDKIGEFKTSFGAEKLGEDVQAKFDLVSGVIIVILLILSSKYCNRRFVLIAIVE